MTAAPDPQVSVIIPTKDRVDYVSQSIQSVLNQTYRNFEIIIVDGSSTTETRDIVENFRDTRIRCFMQRGKKSAASARNQGIRMANGQFVAFLDDDDLWLPQKLEKQIAALSQDDSYSLVYTLNTYVMQSDGKVIGLYNRPAIDGSIYPQILMRNTIGNFNGVLARRKCFEKELFDEKLRALEDWDMLIRLGRRFRFRPVDGPLEAYRLHLKRLTRGYYQVLRATRIMSNKFSMDISTYGYESYWHLLLGLAYLQSGYSAHARREYATVIRMNPHSVGTYFRYLTSFAGANLYNLIQVFSERIAVGSSLR